MTDFSRVDVALLAYSAQYPHTRPIASVLTENWIAIIINGPTTAFEYASASA